MLGFLGGILCFYLFNFFSVQHSTSFASPLDQLALLAPGKLSSSLHHYLQMPPNVHCCWWYITDADSQVLNTSLSLCSGWRPDQTDKCVQCVKLASAETKSSPYMGEEAQVNKTPGE